MLVAALCVGGGSFWFGYDRSANSDPPVAGAGKSGNRPRVLTALDGRPRPALRAQATLDADNRRVVDLALLELPGRESGAHDAASLDALLDLIVDGFAADPESEMDLPKMLQLYDLVARLGPGDFPVALERIEPGSGDYSEVMSALMARWGELDGPAATAFLAGQDRVPLENRINGVLEGWARSDPRAAFDYFLTTRTGHSGSYALEAIFRLWANRDVGAAWDAAMQLDGDSATFALQGMVSEQFDSSVRTELLDRIARLEDSELAKRLRWDVYSSWGEYDPPGAIEALRLAGDPQLFEELGPDAARNWVMMDPTKALAWTRERFTPEMFETVITHHLEMVAAAAPMQARKVIDLLEPGEEADQARAYVARHSVEVSALAAFEFAQEIGDADLRLSAMREVFVGWYDNDEAAALATFGKTEIGDEQIKAWVEEASARSVPDAPASE